MMKIKSQLTNCSQLINNGKNMIALIGAMEEEIKEYLFHAENIQEEHWHDTVFYHADLCGKKVLIVRSGIGKVLAAMVCQHVIDTYKPEKVIFTGVAGALDKSFDIGDVVVSDDLIQHDVNGEALGFSRGTILFSNEKEFKACEELKALALSTPMVEHRMHEGRILTGDQFFTHKELTANAYLTEELAGHAIEMEGAAIAQVCVRNKIPFLVIRTISDKADSDAAEDFAKLLPIIAKNSYAISEHMLKNM